MRYTIDQFIKAANNIHQYLYDYSKIKIYVNNKIKLEIVCKIHGPFLIRGDRHLRGFGCNQCRKDKIKNFKLNDFLIRSNKIYNNFYDYLYVHETFKSFSDLIKIGCPIHGHWYQLAWQHLEGNKCRACSNDDKKLSSEQFLIKAKEIHNDRYDYSKVVYENVATKVIIICSKHGEFCQKPNDHLYRKTGCPNCSKCISHEETKWLNSLQIPLSNRNITLNLGGKNLFPDGIDFDNKIIYEFYGDYWHGNPKIYNADDYCSASKKTFGQMYKKTLEKEEILKSFGYRIISIWESDWKNIKGSYEKR